MTIPGNCLFSTIEKGAGNNPLVTGCGNKNPRCFALTPFKNYSEDNIIAEITKHRLQRMSKRSILHLLFKVKKGGVGKVFQSLQRLE
jgi:hypothetical protein